VQFVFHPPPTSYQSQTEHIVQRAKAMGAFVSGVVKLARSYCDAGRAYMNAGEAFAEALMGCRYGPDSVCALHPLAVVTVYALRSPVCAYCGVCVCAVCLSSVCVHVNRFQSWAGEDTPLSMAMFRFGRALQDMQACQSLMHMSMETTFSGPLEQFYNKDVRPLDDAVKGA
jgi:hypothetical protein